MTVAGFTARFGVSTASNTTALFDTARDIGAQWVLDDDCQDAAAPLAALRAIKTTMLDGQREQVAAARRREDRAFAVTLLVGICVLFAGFLVATTGHAGRTGRRAPIPRRDTVAVESGESAA